MDMNTAVWYATSVVFLLIALQILATPLQVVFKVFTSSVVGGLGLYVLNFCGGLFGFHIGLNPISAVIVGMLGVPGIIALGFMSLLLG